MQTPIGAAQTEQWSWILQTVWGWIWSGPTWIVDWQALVFRTVVFGDSFWQIVGKVLLDRKSTRLNSSHLVISYAVFCLKKKKSTMFSSRPATRPSRTLD